MIGYLLPPTITKQLTIVTGTKNYYIQVTNPNPVDVQCEVSWARRNNSFAQHSSFSIAANTTSPIKIANPYYLVFGGEDTNTATVYLKKTDGDWATAQINQSQSVSEDVPCIKEETTTA